MLGFQYDNLNRMTLKVVPERAGLSSTHTREVYYGYDLRNAQTYARFDGPGGEGMTYAYDAFGRLTSSTLLMDGASRQLGYEYDPGGRRTRITHPDQRSFVYAYDGRSRNSLISDGADMATLAQPVWNDNDTPYGLWRPTGVSYFGQDPVGRLSALSHDVGGTGHDVAFTFGYNPASQITQRTRSNDVFAWGGAYNVSRNYSVNGLNQYTAAGSATFGYDANGNLTSDGSNAFTYDVENRLVAASGAVNASLRYDPLGRLYEVTGASGTTRFLYDGDALVAEYNTSGTLLRRYVHGNAAGADDPLVWFESNARRDLHADHQGTVIAVTDPWGNALAVNSFDEWGIPGAANQGRFQYTGQAWLAELGMYHYKARVYSPTLGRFLQTDPVGYQGGINLYSYVLNDPVNHTDPDGQQPDSVMDRRNQALLQAMEECEGRGAACAQALGQGILVGAAGGAAIVGCVAGGCEAALLFLATRAPAITEIAAGLAEGLAPGAGSATLAASSLSGVMLAKRLALTEQVASIGAGQARVIAGAGAASGRAIDDIGRIVAQHGGRAGDWQKVVARTSGEFSDGTRVSVHAYRNVATGRTVEHRVIQTRAPCRTGTRVC